MKQGELPWYQPPSANFFVASVGAGAALAGLLFLAVTAGTIKSVGYGHQ